MSGSIGGGWSNGASKVRQNMHRYGNETGLSLPDLQIPARPAAYLTVVSSLVSAVNRGRGSTVAALGGRPGGLGGRGARPFRK
jgi:hypothetical protein